MLVPILVLAVLIVLNGVFAMSELAMMTSRRSRLQQRASRGSAGAAAALALSAQPTRFLSTVQVGITMIGIFSGAFAEDSLASLLAEPLADAPVIGPYADPLALVLVVLVVTYASLVFGELVPKRIALAHPEPVASAIAGPLTLLSALAAWPVRLLSVSTDVIARALGLRSPAHDDVSEDDVRALVNRAAGIGVFTQQEHAILDRLFRLGDLTARDLMVHRTSIVWVSPTATAEELRVLIGSSPYSHFPVCRGSIDQIVGVVHAKDLVAHGLLTGDRIDLDAIAQKPVFVPESMAALRLLDQFRASRSHVAFVVNEFGETLGMATLNDIFGALVGDVTRRGEPAPPQAMHRSDGSWLLDGRLPLADALGALAVIPADPGAVPDVSTAGGLVVALLGRVPEEGESAEWMGWSLEVLDMDGTRVDKILAVPKPSVAGTGESL